MLLKNTVILIKISLIINLCFASLFAQTPHQIGIIAHLIYDDNNPPMDESDVQVAVDQLNTNAAFGVFATDIEFFVAGIRTHYSPQFADLALSELNSLFSFYNKLPQYGINLYFVPNASSSDGFASLPSPRDSLLGLSPLPPGVVIQNDKANTSTVVHEFGHFFGLYHTQQIIMGGTREVPWGHPEWENRGLQGDLIADTPAERDPGSGASNYDINCNYDGQMFYDDSMTYPYDPPSAPSIYRPSAANFMTTGQPQCRTSFTAIQKAFMNGVLTGSNADGNDRSYLLNNLWVKVTNEIGGSDAGGSYIVNSETYNSGDYFPYPGQAVDITTGQERFDQTHKHHDWNSAFENYKLVLPGFVATPSSETQRARFMDFDTVTIKNVLISANGIDGGKIWFHDPWFLESDGSQPDDFIEFSSPYQPTGARDSTSGGVFRDQDPNITPVFYSVQSNQQTINGISYFLESWSGTDVNFQDSQAEESAVVFNQPNATITANLKGHLASNLSSATGNNNSRNVAYYENGGTTYWLMTHEDGGHIYYTYDDGTGWIHEERVSQSGSNNSQPTICLNTNTSPVQVTIIWNKLDGSEHEFVWATKSSINGTWGPEYSSDPLYSPSFTKSTKPAAVYLGGLLYISARIDDGSNKILALHRVESDNSLTFLEILPGSNINSDNPTITRSVSGYGDLHLAWEELNNIYYASYNTTSKTFGGVREQVSMPWTGIVINNQPSISYGLDNKINVAWSGFKTSLNAYVLLHRSRPSGSGSWGTMSEIYYSYSNITNATIGSYSDPAVSGWFNVALELNNNLTRIVQFDGSSWTWLPNVTSSRFPALNDQGDDLLLVTTEDAASAPFKINTLHLPSPGEEGLTDGGGQQRFNRIIDMNIRQKHFRKEGADLSKMSGLKIAGSIYFSLGNIHIQRGAQEEAWGFAEEGNSNLVGKFLETKPRLIDAQTDMLTVHFRAGAKNLAFSEDLSDKLLFELRLVDATSRENILSFRESRLRDIGQGDFHLMDSLNIDLRHYYGRQVILQMHTLLDSENIPDSNIAQVNTFEFFDGNARINTTENEEPLVNLQVPKAYALYQNFPNPFNPTTTISIALPESQIATLEIFDTGGRKVRSLVNKQLSAGSHSFLWDGKDGQGRTVSSGIYIYQLKAGSFKESHKMVMMQ